MKKHLSTIALILVLLAGVSLLLYPTVSDYWNARHASKAVADYTQNVQALDQDAYDELLAAAEDYNRSLLTRENGFFLTEKQQAQYESLLDISGTGIMGYIEIPSINVSLPIYHGTSDSVLQIAVGHLDWTSLPVGGESTHCVLSGHRGLPSAKLFTNLDQIVEGDTFIIRVLDEVLTYEVDRILIVEPEDVTALQIESGKDLCTLVTCTPSASTPTGFWCAATALKPSRRKRPSGSSPTASRSSRCSSRPSWRCRCCWRCCSFCCCPETSGHTMTRQMTRTHPPESSL